MGVGRAAFFLHHSKTHLDASLCPVTYATCSAAAKLTVLVIGEPRSIHCRAGYTSLAAYHPSLSHAPPSGIRVVTLHESPRMMLDVVRWMAANTRQCGMRNDDGLARCALVCSHDSRLMAHNGHFRPTRLTGAWLMMANLAIVESDA